MSELTAGNLQGLLTRKDFARTLGRIVDVALDEQKSAGLFVQRHGKEISLDISVLQRPGENPGRTYDLIDEAAIANVGVYISGHPPNGFRPSLVPTLPELAEYQAIRRYQESVGSSQRLIRGIVSPLGMGGAALFLFRESTTRVFAPAELDQMSEAKDAHEAGEVLSLAGLNHALLTYSNGAVNGKPLVGGDIASLFATPDLPDAPYPNQ